MRLKDPLFVKFAKELEQSPDFQQKPLNPKVDAPTSALSKIISPPLTLSNTSNLTKEE
ncbi:hypothetical protein [Coxiella endosymbiont of Rhipicephalus microplus]|uniref:hypothetical protein n=1 Tax=Coxiella endosymbiont of Rhipicephalus microplus TaxID=1656186 RepID=UPI000CC6B7B6|nr:hypothetical protein [Coxiella endosymbiont of Rhipicephalus microplus]PMB54931.1 hypothetical protein CLERM_591 [Coxiella-like endosymbiont]